MTQQKLIRLLQSCLVAMAAIAAAFSQSLAADDPAKPSALRFEPRRQELVPISRDQIVPGKIYKHFSERHGRYVWAFAREGGGFSYALGPGSTEATSNFDLQASQQEVTELLQQEAARWYEASRREGRMIVARLGPDDRWKVLQFSSIRSHFDLDSGRRWEWHGKRRVAVGHTHGYIWQYDGNRYVPANLQFSSICHHCRQ